MLNALKESKNAPYLGLLKDIAIGVLLWFVLTTTVGEARSVPSGSMEPTILIGDRLWTDKLFLRFNPVQRGDIVIFDPPILSDTPYVKRVVGMPGDLFEVQAGKVWINGKILSEPYIRQEPWYNYGPVKVPEGSYVVLGDNRNESNDSHLFGLVTRDRIKARAVFRFWPLHRMGNVE